MTKFYYFNGHYNAEGKLVVESITSNSRSTTLAMLEFRNELCVEQYQMDAFCVVAQPAIVFSGMSPNAAEFNSITNAVGKDFILKFNSNGVLVIYDTLYKREIFQAINWVGPADLEIIKFMVTSSSNVQLFMWNTYTFYTYYSGGEEHLGNTQDSILYYLKPTTNVVDLGGTVSLARLGNYQTDSCNLTNATVYWQETVDAYDAATIVDKSVAAALLSSGFITR